MLTLCNALYTKVGTDLNLKRTLLYLHLFRGTWDHLVPELNSEDMGKVEGYQCNVCEKIFK